MPHQGRRVISDVLLDKFELFTNAKNDIRSTHDFIEATAFGITKLHNTCTFKRVNPMTAQQNGVLLFVSSAKNGDRSVTGSPDDNNI